MANTVQANVDVNITANTNNVESATKEIIAEFNSISSAIDSAMNEPLKANEDIIKDIEGQLDSLMNHTLGLEELIPPSQFDAALDKVIELGEQFNNLKTIVSSLNTEYERQNVILEGGMMKQLQANSSFNMTQEELDALKKENDERQRLISKIDEQYQETLKVADAQSKVKDEFIDTGDYVKTVEQITKEQEQLNSVLEDFTYPGEELKKDEPKVNDYSQVIQLLAKHLGLSNNEAASFTKALGATAGQATIVGAAIGAYITVLKTYVDLLKQCASEITQFGKGALELGVGGVDFFIDAIKDLIDNLEQAIEKMQEFADAGAEIQTAYFNTFTILGSEAGNEVTEFTEKLEKLYGLDGDKLLEDMQSLVAAAGSLGVSTGDAVKATENMTVMANNLSMIAGSFEKASNDIGNAISKGFVGRSSSLYVLMTKAEKDALKDLGSEVERYNYLMSLSGRIKDRYIAYLDTEAGRVMQLKNQYGILVNNISKLALGLYAKIAPVLTELLKLANRALTSIMRLFKIDLKASADTGTGSIAEGISTSMKKAGDSSKKAAKDIKKSTKDSGKALKELERQVASFDDVIQIKDNKANDDLIDLGDLDDGLDDIGDLDSGLEDLIGDFDLLGDAIDDTNHDFDEFWKRIDAGDYEGAGAWLANYLADKLWSIDWDLIKLKAGKAGTAIADFFNGINKDKRLWAGIGHTVAEALNSIIMALVNFADIFDFREFGDSLAVAWKQFWDDFDEVTAGEALYEWFMGIFDTVGAFFEKSPLSTMANSLVIMLNKFFSSITDEDISNMSDTLISIIQDVFNAVAILMDGLEEGEAGEKIQKFLQDLFTKVGDNAGTWGETLGNLIKKILTFLYEAITNADKSGLSDSIANFLGGLDLEGIFDAWFKLKMEFIWIIIESAIKTLLNDIYNKLTDESDITLGEALETIATLLNGFIGKLFFKVGEFIGEKIGELFIDTDKSINENIKNILKTIEEGWNTVLQGIQRWIQKIKDAIIKPFQGLNPFSGINWSISGSSHGGFRIPRLMASGGIVNGATNAIVGEAGREAVLPLERNTGWMDVLAEKIAGINGGGNNTPVVIDMSAANKPVYTRSEYLAMADIFAEAMKARGVAVSMEY